MWALVLVREPVLCCGQILVEKGRPFWEGMGTWGITGAVQMVTAAMKLKDGYSLEEKL